MHGDPGLDFRLGKNIKDIIETTVKFDNDFWIK